MNIDLPATVLSRARVVDLNRFFKWNVSSIQVVDIEAINYQILNIIQTEKGTYPFEPTFGVNLEKYLFRLSSSGTLFSIQNEVTAALNQWLKYGNVKPRNVKAVQTGLTTVTLSVAVDLLGSTRTFTYRLSV